MVETAAPSQPPAQAEQANPPIWPARPPRESVPGRGGPTVDETVRESRGALRGEGVFSLLALLTDLVPGRLGKRLTGLFERKADDADQGANGPSIVAKIRGKVQERQHNRNIR